jgi:hypothetical protein
VSRRPWALYQSLLATQGDGSEAERVRALRRALRSRREAWPPEVRAIVDEAGVGEGYLQRGLLSIASFAPEVRDALRRGLPFAVARRVNRIDDAERRSAVLAPLLALGGDPEARLLPRGLARRIEADALGVLAAQRAGTTTTGCGASEDGWLEPIEPAGTPRRLPGQVWTFELTRGAAAGAEPLAARVVEALLARLLPRGGALVDVTAGAGTIAAVAHRFGVRTWSGDIAPAGPFVQRADARVLMRRAPVGLRAACADLLVVHPPTYPVWRRGRAAAHEDQLDHYRDDVASMIAGSLQVVRPGRHVVVVSRPVRSTGAVWLSTSHLAEALDDVGVRVVGYVVAVARGGSEDWHLLIGQAPGAEPRAAAGTS